MRNESREKMLQDIFDIISTVDIATDKSTLADKQSLSQVLDLNKINSSIQQQHNCCCSHINEIDNNFNNGLLSENDGDYRRSSGGAIAQLIRSCTTAD